MEEKNISALLDKHSLFWSPEYLDISAWVEHIPFAFWLIDVLRPKIIVELGVHNGPSYFAFCQAVKALNLDTLCYGVDTWTGDEHAGFYDDQVLAKVAAHNDAKYARFSTLIQSTFDEANKYFVNQTIELLHIDGLHTYDAVRHDFDNWLPKLHPDGFVIFHDINVREKQFGVFQLWEDLKKQYQHLQFDFGHGLGIIALGTIKSPELKQLFNIDKRDAYYIFLRNLFFDRGNIFKLKLDHSKILAAEKDKLEKVEVSHTELDGNYKTLEAHYLQLIEERRQLHADNQQLKESENGLRLQHGLFGEKNSTLTTANNQLTQHIAALELSNTTLTESLRELEANQKQLKELQRNSEVSQKSQRDKYEVEKKESLNRLDEAKITIKKLTTEIANQKHAIAQLTHDIEHQTQALRWYKETYEDRSILGTLKEKVRSRLKKKIVADEGVKKFTLNTNFADKDKFPVIRELIQTNLGQWESNDLLQLEGSGKYSSTGKDPFFLIDMSNSRFLPGWYLLSIEISFLKGGLVLPKLYFDYGRGFNEEDVWNLPNIKNGRIQSLVNFPFDIFALRFDPTSAEGTFHIQSFHIKRVNKLKALQVAIPKYKEVYAPEGSYLTLIKEVASSLVKTGKSEVRRKMWEAVASKEDTYVGKYRKWCALFDTITDSQFETIKSLSDNLAYQPVFSIVMPVYNAPVQFLKKAIESVRNQPYKNWELCIADDKSTNKDVRVLLTQYQAKDPRIKIMFRETNGHISHASNSALELATGDYVVLLDQDDELTAHSLYLVAAAINTNRNLELIYSDEDKIDENGKRFDPYFKTDWNKDLFYGHNMISHLGVYKTSLIKKIGGFRAGYEGSQDYDLALRCIELLRPDQIHHIPHVLYHWRAIKGSTALTVSNKNYAFDAGLKALQSHLERTNEKARAAENVFNSYKVIWELPAKKPLVSIIIPTKDQIEVLEKCVASILQKTDYKNYEILIIDNNSEERSTLEYFKKIVSEFQQVSVHQYNDEFNFSAIVNYGVELSNGEVILLLNNDTEVINAEWLGEMVSQCMRKEIGAVGAKLFYPNGQIQHAGVFLYEGHPGNHIYMKRNKDDLGYFNKLNLVQYYSAVTAACLAVRKELYLEVGGFDETNLKVAYNDVDFCLKLTKLGYKNLWTPFAQLVHYESLSRGNDLHESNYERFKKEHSYMLKKWKDVIAHDPFFNPNLYIETHNNQFRFPPKERYEWEEQLT